ncbi:MAG: hypothetical protein RL018_8, partial [Pseudomonadota bacterium]
LAFADVLLPDTGGKSGLDTAWHMIEVKSSTSVKDYYREDAAIQYYVAKNAGLNLASISLAVVDTSWVYRGDGNYNGLLKLEDVTDSSAAQDADVRAWIADAQLIAKFDEAPEKKTGDHCNSPFPCGFYAHCASEDGTAALSVPHPIGWLPRMSKIKVKAVFGANAVPRQVSMFDMPDALLNALQRRVKMAHQANQAFVDVQGLQQRLGPQRMQASEVLSFLDFETVAQAVPVWAGTRPYQAVLVQFSCHVLDLSNATDEGKSLKHYEFLDTSGNDPRPALAEALIVALGDSSGAVFMYSSFERTQLRALALAVPQHRVAIERIIGRLVDLLPVVRDHYYHPLMQGSWSIKSVLPAMLGNQDTSLSYDALAASVEGGAVADGGAAMQAYIEAIDPSTPLERKAAINTQLLAYCKLDTLAMVRVWQRLCNMAVNGDCAPGLAQPIP